MRIPEDLTGQVFGDLTVVELLPERYKGRGAVWRCRCSCGNERNVLTTPLKSGRVTHCGCKNANMRSDRREDLVGKTFGELTVIKQTDQRIRGYIAWECQCSCGKKCLASASSLLTGQKKSCGHLRHQGVDITGKRFGRLTALYRLKAQPAPSASWLYRCDCGGVTIQSLAALSVVRSCGCLLHGKGATRARCPSCGKPFPITLDGTPTPQFCPDCAPQRAGRAWRVCPICGELFPASPSDNAVTCSTKACVSAWKSRIHTGVSNEWSDESKARLSAKGQTDNLKLGTAAAQRSPIAGRFETNREAKVWELINPTGKQITVRNLLLWAREHTELFDKPPGDKSARQIAAGFKAIAQTLAGKREKQRPAMTYKGWTLAGLPTKPENTPPQD